MSGTILGAGISVENKTKGICPHGTFIIVGMTDNNKVKREIDAV